VKSTIPNGRYAWLWQLNTIRDYLDVFRRAKHLGFTGLWLHAQGHVLNAVMSVQILDAAKRAGILIGGSAACDTGSVTRGPDGKVLSFTPTHWEKFADNALRFAELCPDGGYGFDREGRWDRNRKEDALKIINKIGNNNPEYFWWDMAWWKPNVHPNFPYKEFCGDKLLLNGDTSREITYNDKYVRVLKQNSTQCYPLYSAKNSKGNSVVRMLQPPKDWKYEKLTHLKTMTPVHYQAEISARQYAQMNYPVPLSVATQGCSTLGMDKHLGAVFRDFPVTNFWHFFRVEQDIKARRLFRAAAIIDSLYPRIDSYKERVEAFQSDNGLTVDGWVYTQTIEKALLIGKE
jgi:hypothetical protein